MESKEFKTPAGVSISDKQVLQELDEYYTSCGETLQRWLENHIHALVRTLPKNPQLNPHQAPRRIK